MIIGLSLGVAGAFVGEGLDTRVRGVESAEKASGLTVVGVIPDLSKTNRGSEILLLDPESDAWEFEAFRRLLTNIEFASIERPKVILISGSEPSEGKSTVALNLSLMLSEQHRDKVVLVDADMRRPCIHIAFGLDREPGLTDVLVGKCSFNEAVQRPAGSDLLVLPCGTSVPNPAELFHSQNFLDLISFVRARVHTLIIDAPPVLAVTDPVVIGRAVDGILLVARDGLTDRRVLSSGVSHFRQVGLNPLGVVLNRARESSALGGYGLRSKYYKYYTNSNGPADVRGTTLKGRASAPAGRAYEHSSGEAAP